MNKNTKPNIGTKVKHITTHEIGEVSGYTISPEKLWVTFNKEKGMYPCPKSNLEIIRSIPAIPPEDYSGSVGKWAIELQERGLWDGEGWYGDVMITSDEWWSILNKLEEL